MATAAATIEDAITCCVCFDVYRDPHALPCLHMLCKPCIDQLAVRGRVECPECRESSNISKIRKDFKAQSLIDAQTGKGEGNGGGSVAGEECGMCREPGKEVSSHCRECEHFMCTRCENTHEASKVYRGHTVRAMKDIFKMDACVEQWKAEKTKIISEAKEIETFVESVQRETQEQIELTNKHFDKVIGDLEKKRFELVNEITEANEVSVQSLRKNKRFYDQISTEIQSKIDVLHEVINGKHTSTMSGMVDDMDESLKEQIRKHLDKLAEQVVLRVKVHIDEKTSSINTAIKLERLPQLDLGSADRSKILYSDYSKLKTNRYQFNMKQHCNNESNRICIIENNIWCAAWNNGLQIYDKNMQLIKKINFENFSQVTGLAEWCGDIIVASNDTGLHQITQAGDYVKGITDGMFSDVSSNRKYVYGLKREPQRIVIFNDEKNKWTEKSEILLKTGDGNLFDKLIVNTDSLLIGISHWHCIQKYSLEGKLQQTFGYGGILPIGLKYPILSGVDIYENLLVADVEKKQLKVYCSEEKAWHVVPVKLDLEPYDAVMDDNNIWIMTGGVLSSTFLKFTKI